jgi:hypothetical protein
MFRGVVKTWNRESDVNAFAGVKSPPSKVNVPNETSVTITGMMFSIKLLNCNRREIVSQCTCKVPVHLTPAAQKDCSALVSIAFAYRGSRSLMQQNKR